VCLDVLGSESLSFRYDFSFELFLRFLFVILSLLSKFLVLFLPVFIDIILEQKCKKLTHGQLSNFSSNLVLILATVSAAFSAMRSLFLHQTKPQS